MMKFAACLLAFIVGAKAQTELSPLLNMPNSIAADSPMGMRLLSEARQLADDGSTFSHTWVSGFSLKFEGCHEISQWNDEAVSAKTFFTFVTLAFVAW